MILLKQIEGKGIFWLSYFLPHTYLELIFYFLYLLNQYFKIEAVFKLFLNLQVHVL